MAKLKKTSDLLEGCKSSQNRRMENQAQKRKGHRGSSHGIARTNGLTKAVFTVDRNEPQPTVSHLGITQVKIYHLGWC